MSVMKAVWATIGVGLLGTFIALSLWGIPSPLATIEKQVAHERLSQ